MTEDASKATVELIQELDLIVTQNPTNVWMLQAEKAPLDFICYEQWEKGRPFKAKAVYHHPSGSDYYLKNADDPFGVLDIDTSKPFMDDELKLAPERPGKRHKLGPDETVHSVALAYKISPTLLMDHNEIKDPKTIRPGHWLYIPSAEKKERHLIEYKILTDDDGRLKPRPMHISKEDGTTKFTFGAVRKWSDIKPDNKHYGLNHNVDIVAVAKVPIEDTVAAYYMDKHDLGKYQTTGRPAYTRGFNWQHLAEGYAPVEEKQTKMEQIVADAMAEDDRPPEPEPSPEPVEEAVDIVENSETDEPEVSPLEKELDAWKGTFRYFNVEESPEEYEMLQDYEVRDLDGIMPPRLKKEGGKLLISGWFTHNDTPYYRVATRYWYAVPVHMARSCEDDAFNDRDLPTTLAERANSGGYLTPSERRLVRMAQFAAKTQKLKKIPGLFRHK